MAQVICSHKDKCGGGCDMHGTPHNQYGGCVPGCCSNMDASTEVKCIPVSTEPKPMDMTTKVDKLIELCTIIQEEVNALSCGKSSIGHLVTKANTLVEELKS